jgi:hypothetical protein
MVQRELLTGPFAAADQGLGDQDDRIGMWGIEQAREFAGTTAQTLWRFAGHQSSGPSPTGWTGRCR